MPERIVHPTAAHLKRASESLVKRCIRLINAGAEWGRSQPARLPEPSRLPAGLPGGAPWIALVELPAQLHFTDSNDANRLIASNPMALLIGFLLDQQVSVQKAAR